MICMFSFWINRPLQKLLLCVNLLISGGIKSEKHQFLSFHLACKIRITSFRGVTLVCSFLGKNLTSSRGSCQFWRTRAQIPVSNEEWILTCQEKNVLKCKIGDKRYLVNLSRPKVKRQIELSSVYKSQCFTSPCKHTLEIHM